MELALRHPRPRVHLELALGRDEGERRGRPRAQGKVGKAPHGKRGRVGTRGRGHRVRISLGEREEGHTEQHTDTRTHTTKTLRLTRRLERAAKTRAGLA